jgi:hypothetical protein
VSICNSLTNEQLFKQTHTVYGTVIVCALVIQPFLGFLHHNHFKAHGARGSVSYFHIWWGRLLLAMGVINGGLGLLLANERNSLVTAYAVVAGVVYGVYILGKLAIFFGRKRKNTVQKAPSTPPQHASQSYVSQPYEDTRKERGGRYV